MACYKPLKAWKSCAPKPDGKHIILFGKVQDFNFERIELPCGRCIGCRLNYSKQWAIRCMHEASLHDENCFITLTYAPEHLPFHEPWHQHSTLYKPDFQKFMKRFRKRTGSKFKYYYCGEYGEKYFRPHYHACIFGYDFPDKYRVEDSPSGQTQWASPLLDDLWGLGRARIGTVTYDSAGYVARYMTKKVKGKDAATYYERLCEETGEIYRLLPEYTDMSRGGRTGKGIAADWFDEFSTDVYPSDSVIVKGKPVRPPRYYDGMYEQIDPQGYEEVKKKRLLNIEVYKEHCTRS